MKTENYYEAACALERMLDRFPKSDYSAISNQHIIDWLDVQPTTGNSISRGDIVHFVETYPYLPNVSAGLFKPFPYHEPKIWNEQEKLKRRMDNKKYDKFNRQKIGASTELILE